MKWIILSLLTYMVSRYLFKHTVNIFILCVWYSTLIQNSCYVKWNHLYTIILCILVLTEWQWFEFAKLNNIRWSDISINPDVVAYVFYNVLIKCCTKSSVKHPNINKYKHARASWSNTNFFFLRCTSCKLMSLVVTHCNII